MLRTYSKRKPELVGKPTLLQPTTKATIAVDKENASSNLQAKHQPTKALKTDTIAEKPREVKRSRPQEARAPLGRLLGPPPKRSKPNPAAAKKQTTAATAKKTSAEPKDTSKSSLTEYFEKKKAEFDNIDKFELAEISYSVEAEQSLLDEESFAQSDAVNREIIELSSIIGSVSGFISLDADSMAIEDQGADDLPEVETLSNVAPLASSNDDFEQKKQKQQRQKRTVTPKANIPATSTTPDKKTRPQRRSNPPRQQKKSEEPATNQKDLEDFIFSHFIQPTSIDEAHDVPSPSKDGDLPFFAATPAPKALASKRTSGKRQTRKNQSQDLDLEKLVFEQFVQPKSGEQ